MITSYPAKYRDSHGEEITTVQNNGKMLGMVIRGVEFTGFMFDDWEPNVSDASKLDHLFPVHMEALCACSIECTIPVLIVANGKTLQGNLQARIELGKPSANGGLDREEIQLELLLEGSNYRSCGKHGWFEDELVEIQKQLPVGVFIKSCFNCAYSTYIPGGNGSFGCLSCFRGIKQAFLSADSKQKLLAIADQATETVQETYLCPEFMKAEF